MKTRTMKLVSFLITLLLSTNLYSYDPVEYFDSVPSSKDSNYKDKNNYYNNDRRDRDRNSDSNYDRRDSDRDRNSDYNSNYDRRDKNSDYDRYDRRDSDYNNYNRNDRRDSDYNNYDRNDRRDYHNDYDRNDRRDYHDDYYRKERNKEKTIWEEVSKEDTIDSYKAFLKTFPNSTYANLAKYKIEKLTSYGSVDAKVLETYKNIPYWVTNGELEDKSEQAAVISIDLDRDNQIQSLREAEKQARDVLSRNYYLLSTDIIKTNFFILDKRIYALAYVANNKKAERNKHSFK